MRFPLLWVALSVCSGIGLAEYLNSSSPTVLISSLALILLALLSHQIEKLHLFQVSIVLSFILQGALLQMIRQQDFPPHHLRLWIDSGLLDLSGPCRIRGMINRDPVQTPFGYYLRVELRSLENGNRHFDAVGGIRLTVPFDVTAHSIQPCAFHFGDEVQGLVLLRRPQAFRNPGVFDFAAQLRREGIWLIGNLKSSRLLERVGNRRWAVQGAVYDLRRRMASEIDRTFSRGGHLLRSGALLQAALLGNRYFLDRSMEQDFQSTGIYHVLVISGLHVGIIAWSLLAVFRVFRIPSIPSTMLTLLFLVSYAFMVEMRVPIVRAVVMIAIYLSASFLERDRIPLNAVGGAALLICWWQPDQLFDPGFQLSFASVLSIAAIGVPLVDRWWTGQLQALEGLGEIERDIHLGLEQAALRVRLRFVNEVWGQRPVFRLLPFSWRAAALVAGTRVYYRVLSLLVCSLSIQLTFSFLMAGYFNRVTLSAPALNLMAIPLMGMIVPMGLLQLAVSFFSHVMADLLGRILFLLIEILIRASHALAGVGWLSFRVPDPPAVLLVTAAVLTVAFTCSLFKQKWVTVFGGGGLFVCFALIIISPFPANQEKGQLVMTVLDVGQGDSIFVQFPDGRTMLVDGGGVAASGFHEHPLERRLDIGEDVVSPYLWWRRLKSVDRVVLTHAHNDHILGLMAVVRNFSVKELWVGENPSVPLLRELLEIARHRGVLVRQVQRGEQFEMGGTRMEILAAGRGVRSSLEANNDDSVVIWIHHGQTSLMLTGDIGGSMEDGLVGEIEGKGRMETTVLKVAHHGSNTSTSTAFLNALRPHFAIISVASPSPFGHPSPKVMERLAQERILLYSTGRDGAIEARSDGRVWNVGKAGGKN